MPHLCIDIDNVIARTDDVVRAIIAEVTNGEVNLKYDDITTYNYYECQCAGPDGGTIGISREQWRTVHDLLSQRSRLLSLKPMARAAEALNELASGCDIHFVTSRLRHSHTRTTTIEWLHRHGFPEHDLHFVSHMRKHVVMGPCLIWVEDHYEQAVEVASYSPCILYRHPWNSDREQVDGLEWARDWDEIHGRIEHLIRSA